MSPERIKEKLADIYCIGSVLHKQQNVSIQEYQFESFEKDGRKRKSVIRNLVEEGYINIIGGNYCASSKAFKEVQEKSFTVASEFSGVSNELIDKYDTFVNLKIEHKKFVLNNLKDFQFFIFKNGNHIFIDINEKLDFEFYTGDIKIADSNFQEYVRKATFDKKFELCKKQNLLNGFVKFGLLPEDKLFMFDPTLLNLRINPSLPGLASGKEWNEHLQSKIDSYKQAMVEITEKINVMQGLHDQINVFGGWDKFNKEYESFVLEEMEKQNV